MLPVKVFPGAATCGPLEVKETLEKDSFVNKPAVKPPFMMPPPDMKNTLQENQIPYQFMCEWTNKSEMAESSA